MSASLLTSEDTMNDSPTTIINSPADEAPASTKQKQPFNFKKEWEDFKENARIAIAEVRHGIHRASWRIIFLVVIGIVMSIAGAGGQIITMNQWLFHFVIIPSTGKPAGGPYTVVLSSGLSSLVLYIFVYLFWQLKYRPGFDWVLQKDVWKYCGGAGLLLACNGFLAVYSTPHVAEVVQALLIASQIVWTLLFAVIFKINQGKNYFHFLVIVAIVLSITGIVVGTLATKAPSGGDGHVVVSGGIKFIWAMLYMGSTVFGSLINVVAAKFFMSCTYDEEEEELLALQEAEEKEKKRLLREEQEALERERYGSSLVPRGASSAHPPKHTISNMSDHGSAGAGSPTRLKDHVLNNARADRSSLLIANNKKFNKLSSLAIRSRSDFAEMGGGMVSDLEDRSKDLQDCENEDDEEEEVLLAKEELVPVSSKIVEIGHAQVLFLLIGTFFQCLTILAAMPLDWAPFFGFSPSSTDTVNELTTGFQCMFNSLDLDEFNFTNSNTSNSSNNMTNGGDDAADGPSCASNLMYFIAFAVFFSITNAGNVIVNSFSAPLTSMVAQIASPITAIILEIAPSLAPHPQQSNVAMATIGAILLIVGAMLFSFWEEMTSERKYELNELVKEGALTHVASSKTALDRLGESTDYIIQSQGDIGGLNAAVGQVKKKKSSKLTRDDDNDEREQEQEQEERNGDDEK